MRLLFICGALGAGEFAASFAPTCAEGWAAVALLAVVVALFGYGLAVRGWWLAAIFIAGAALFLFAATEQERLYREKPWLRGRVERRAGSEPPAAVRLVRRDFSQRVALGIERDRETVSLCRAILLGERWRLSKQAKRLFVESGTMHVFAISGLHVMAIADVLSFLLGFLFVPLRVRGVAAIPLLWGYVGLVGFAPSAVRAAVMATFQLLAPLLWRRPNGLRAWELTFLTVHVVNPLLVTNVGNALSFAVMLAIVIAGECGRGLSAGRQKLLTTVVAWAAGVPIAAHVFGRVTPGGMLANLVLISAAKTAVMSGAVGILASYVSSSLAAHLNNFGALTVRAMVLTAEAVARLPGANVETGCWSLAACAAWYAVCGFGALALLARAGRSRVL